MPDLFSLEGKTALVTGGNSGLGKAMALGLREAGARVAVTGRDAGKNAAMVAEIGDGAVFALDVRDGDAVSATVTSVAERFGGLDILVNNAGLFRGGPLLGMKREDWQAVIDTHLTGSFLCAQAAAAAMTARGAGGKIINIGSMYSVYGALEAADYGSAKTGLLGLTRALAVELAPHGIPGERDPARMACDPPDPAAARDPARGGDPRQDTGRPVGTGAGRGRRGGVPGGTRRRIS